MLKARKLKVLITVLLSGGYGITIHAIAGELYDKGGYREILSFQGEWIGMFILGVGCALSIMRMWRK